MKKTKHLSILINHIFHMVLLILLMLLSSCATIFIGAKKPLYLHITEKTLNEQNSMWIIKK